MRKYYTVLKKELEHPWILVSEGNLEPVLLRILRDDCIYELNATGNSCSR